MTELGERRIRIEIDNESETEIFDKDGGGYSDVPSIVEETRQKIRADEWRSYIIMIEKAVPGGWDIADSMGASVHTAGFEGTYDSPDKITDQQLRDAVQEMWDIP